MAIILDLVEQIAPLAEGMQTRVSLTSAADIDHARAWCESSGNTLVAVGDGWLTVQRGRVRSAAAPVPADRRPGVRLWIYTNFDCNLECSYCCVRSSPRAARRAVGAELITQLALEAVGAGVREIYLTGGEPFLVPDIGESIRACAERLPTTVLTNAMLFKGRRLEVLKSLPRNVTLQISLDSPTPERHDHNRGAGAWTRTVEGIQLVLGLGFRVRIAATVDAADKQAAADEPRFHELLDEWAIAHDDRLIRPWAQRGNADHGTVVTQEAVIPEVTITAEGVYWHPVAATDPDMLVTTAILPLQAAIDQITTRFYAQRESAATAAELFPCA